MCNARNHSSDCACGFGPPYAVRGTYKVEKEEEWADAVIVSKSRIIRGLREVCFSSQEIKNALAQYRTMAKDRKGLKDWFKGIIDQRQYFDIKNRTEWITIPLFRLHLPAFDGMKIPESRVTYEETKFIERGQNWSFRILGIGMGKTQLLKVSCSSQAVAENGQCKLIYVKIPIRVTEVEVVNGNRPIESFLRTEIDPDYVGMNFHNGTGDCLKKDCEGDWDYVKPPTDLFPLIASSKDSIGKFSKHWKYGSGRKLEVDIHAFGIKSSMSLYVYRGKELTLRFELPGGYDYLLMPLKNNNGIKWKLHNTDGWKLENLEIHRGLSPRTS